VKRLGAMAVLLTAVLAGCTMPGDGPPTTPTRPTVQRPMFQDERLRPVRMTSGAALGYVQPETASQVLCQLLDKAGWERLLDGAIGRRPLSGPEAGCQIATGLGMISMVLREAHEPFKGNSTGAGRPATVDTEERVVFTVALSDDALRPAPSQYYQVRRLLELQAIGDDADQQQDISVRVLDTIVPLLVKDGGPLPTIDDHGYVRYVSTPVTDDFVDLPTPVQALQLCTLAQQSVAGATVVDVHVRGECRLSAGQDNVVVAADDLTLPADYPDRIAGRPATVDKQTVHVRLRDDAEVELYVSAPDSVTLAGKLVPKLVD
jgi:hypothetical protein